MKQPPDTTLADANPSADGTARQRGGGGAFDDPARDRAHDGESVAEAAPSGQVRWARALDDESARIARDGRWASVVVIDLVRRTSLVDESASPDAEAAIPMLTGTIRRHAREADIVVTLGPGRHGILLVATDQVQAINFVERIRSACDPWLARLTPDLRVAIGWADARPGRSIHEAEADAEAALERDRRAAWTF